MGPRDGLCKKRCNFPGNFCVVLATTADWHTGCVLGVNLPGVVFSCPDISPASAPLPNLQASAGRTKSSYPMHVSGHEMVEWVQRYACAKLSETIRLAGGWVIHGGNQLSHSTLQKRRLGTQLPFFPFLYFYAYIKPHANMHTCSIHTYIHTYVHTCIPDTMQPRPRCSWPPH